VWTLLSAVLAILIGAFLVWRPFAGIVTLTLALVAFFAPTGWGQSSQFDCTPLTSGLPLPAQPVDETQVPDSEVAYFDKGRAANCLFSSLSVSWWRIVRDESNVSAGIA